MGAEVPPSSSSESSKRNMKNTSTYDSKTQWYPSHIFSPANLEPSRHEEQEKGRTYIAPNPNSYAVLILNQPFNIPALEAVLPGAEVLVCADGGANHYLDYYRNSLEQYNAQQQQEQKTEVQLDNPNRRAPRLPDAVIGDLDSLYQETRLFFENQHHSEPLSTTGSQIEGQAKKVEFIQIIDDYSTDFAKCLKWLRRYSITLKQQQHHTDNITSSTRNHEENQTSNQETGLDVIVLGSLGGRVDQGLSQLHHLYLATTDDQYLYSPSSHPPPSNEPDETKTPITKNTRQANKIYLLSESSLSFVLEMGVNEIYIDNWTNPPPTTTNIITDQDQKEGKTHDGDVVSSSTCEFTEKIGILPLAGPSTITTKGFEWDVEDWKTEFGGLLSTSNHIRSDVLIVDVKPFQRFDGQIFESFAATATDHFGDGGDSDKQVQRERQSIMVPGRRCVFTLELERRLRVRE